MMYTIQNGTSVDIVKGSKIITLPGFLPKELDGQWITITDAKTEGPYAQSETSQKSVISPEIILVVV